MKTILKKWGFSVTALLTGAVMIVAMLFAFNINTEKTIESFRHNSMEEMNHTALISLNYNLQTFVDLLEQQAEIFALLEDPSDEKVMSTLEKFSKSERFKNSAIMTYEGKVYSSYLGIVQVKTGEMQPNLYKEGTVISQPRIFSDGALVIDISTPVILRGKKAGKLVATVDSTTLAKMFNASLLQGDAALCLVAQDGTVLTRISKRESPLGTNSNLFDFYNAADIRFLAGSREKLMRDFSLNQSNWLQYNLGKEHVCVFYEPIGRNGWYLCIAATDASLVAQAANFKKLALLLTIGILIVVSVVVAMIMLQRIKEQEKLTALKNTYSIAIRKTNDLFYETDMDSDLFIDHSEHAEKAVWTETPKNYKNALEQMVDVCTPEYRQEFLDTFLPQNIKIKIKQGISSINFEYKITTPKNTVRWLSATLVPIVDPSTNSTRLICMQNDITEHMLRQESLQQRAVMDGLTGLYNKVTAMQCICAFLGNEGKNGTHAFFMVDIDLFKLINDNLGHATGDEVLSEFGRALKKVFRKNDVVGRMGGDEFVVLLKDCADEMLIVEKANEIGEIIRKKYTLPTGEALKTTASIGIALYPKDGKNADELYANADAALYASKKAGKDRYTFFDGGMKKA